MFMDNNKMTFSPRSQLAVIGLVLAALGMIKLYSWTASSIPETLDMVFSVSLRSLTLFMGIAEMALALCLLGLVKPLTAAKLCTFAGFAFLAYRWLHASLGGSNAPCPCLGALSSWVGFLAAHEQNILASAALWICLVGLWSWMKEAVEQ
jgi:hypothetical protein